MWELIYSVIPCLAATLIHWCVVPESSPSKMREDRNQQQNQNLPSPSGLISPLQVSSKPEPISDQRGLFPFSWGRHFLFGNSEVHKQAEEIESLRSYNSQLHQHLEQQCALLGQFDETFEEQAQHIRELEQQLESSEIIHEEKIKRLRKRISELQNTVSALREQISELQTIKAIADDIKISDNAISEVWNRMAYNIRSTAVTLLTHYPPKEELERGYQDCPSAISQMASTDYHWLQDENMRYLVVQKYIWRFVNSHIFGNGQLQELWGAWGGSAGVGLYLVSSSLLCTSISQENAAEFFAWKSQAAIMIDKLVGCQSQTLQQLAMRGYIAFSFLLPPEKRQDESETNTVYSEFLSICKDAAELQSIFMKSKAHIRVLWANELKSRAETMGYRPDEMEAEEWGNTLSDKSVVKLNISPGLLKCGTASGVDYDQSIWLAKPRVVCD